jgi:hypothetical protein
MPALKITPIAYRPSRLSIPCSPFSPRLPITPPPLVPRLRTGSVRRRSPHTTPPPANPLQWLWQCHVCKIKYPLGATRRCLEDGHHFCAGTSIVRSRKGGKRIVKRHAPCASEFDYQGWKVWGEWRQAEAELQKALAESAESVLGTSTTENKDCWNRCDYPSECRWGPKLKFQNPSRLGESLKSRNTAIAAVSAEEREEPVTNFEEILKLEEPPVSPEHPPPPKDDFWSVLLTSATKRKSGRSPLGLSVIAEQEEKENILDTDSSKSSESSEEDFPILGAEAITPPPPTLHIPIVRTALLLDHADPMDIDEVDNVLPQLRKSR